MTIDVDLGCKATKQTNKNCAQLSWAWKKFYNLGPDCLSNEYFIIFSCCVERKKWNIHLRPRMTDTHSLKTAPCTSVTGIQKWDNGDGHILKSFTCLLVSLYFWSWHIQKYEAFKETDSPWSPDGYLVYFDNIFAIVPLWKEAWWSTQLWKEYRKFDGIDTVQCWSICSLLQTWYISFSTRAGPARQT